MKLIAIFLGLTALASSVAGYDNPYQDNPYENAPCTITLRRLVQIKNLVTSTTYVTTHTATRYVDCHGCGITTKRLGGHGPRTMVKANEDYQVQHATATVTSKATTTTTTMCSPSIR
ncbi:MAG: hypothetical protein M1816_004388 [Peltula sp. TS41687]|nr:MAG: hypothetical protein M1816_004388 [Peltula sp. TS41687]